MGSLVPFQGVLCPADVIAIKPKIEPVDESPLQVQYPSSSNHGGFPSSSTHGGGDELNVFSEFNRIEELFSTAFSIPPESQAIVPVKEQTETAAWQKDSNKRSSELVRVTDLSSEDEKYFRSIVRRTRLIFDSLRVFIAIEEDKRVGLKLQRHSRVDLRVSKAMKDTKLWLNRDKRIVGAIPGVYIGDIFFFRVELCVLGIHGQHQAGIDYLTASLSPNGDPIATSVIVSGGYEDDEDSGDVITYTGHGGQDKNFRQCSHQKLECGNLGLERSMHYGIEVRVIRGFKYEGSMGKVYVYDGLYNVTETWFDVGKSGFGVYKFRLVRIKNQPEMGTSILKFAQNLRSSPLSYRPKGYLSLDLSMKKETVPVYLFNDIDNDNEPLYYEYMAKTVYPPYAYQLRGGQSGCFCVSICDENCSCVLRNGGEFVYDRNGILIRGKPLIFECGSHCKCSQYCRNRVTQKGLTKRFEVFRSKETGWGVRSLDLIPAGSFICEYAGIVLTKEQAQIISMNGDSLIHPNRFTERYLQWGDLSQVFSDYVKPMFPSIAPLEFSMDVSKMRNVACYISQSRCPNVFVQLVLYDHYHICYPHLMLFALENIPPLRELSLDYGMPRTDELEVKLPICN